MTIINFMKLIYQSLIFLEFVIRYKINLFPHNLTFLPINVVFKGF